MPYPPRSAGPVGAVTHRFDTANPLELSVRNQAGTVEVTAADVVETTVEIVPNDAKGAELAERTRVQLGDDGRTLRIEVPDRKVLRQPPLEIIVTVPTRSAVDIGTATAEVHTRGSLEGATVSTASADVALAEVTGRLRVTTASGDVYLGRCDGPVQVRTASGAIRLDVSNLEASVHTASGDVEVGRLTGDLTARSASGDLVIGTASAGSVQAKSMSGDVVIGVAGGLLVWLDVHSMSGDVSSQLGPDGASEGNRPDDAGTDADADASRDPDLRITATTMSGDIQLRRGR